MDRPTAGMRWLCSLLGSASSASWVLVRSGQSIARPGTRRPRRDGTGLERPGNEAEPDGERGPRVLVNPAGQRLSSLALIDPRVQVRGACRLNPRVGPDLSALPACRPERWQRLASRCSRSEPRSTQDGQQLPHRDPPPSRPPPARPLDRPRLRRNRDRRPHRRSGAPVCRWSAVRAAW